MNFSNIGADLITNVVAGIIGAMLVLFLVERRRRPELSITIEYNHPDFQNSTFLRLNIANIRLRVPLALIYNREPALMCRAWISFHYTDGTKVYQNDMVGRWAKSPEPVSPFLDVTLPDGRSAILITKADTTDWFDIASGEQTILDVVRRFHNETDCYGWNNDGYTYHGKNPNWKLEKGRYLVQVRVQTGGKEFTKIFQLINDADFRLEPFSKPFPVSVAR